MLTLKNLEIVQVRFLDCYYLSPVGATYYSGSPWHGRIFRHLCIVLPAGVCASDYSSIQKANVIENFSRLVYKLNNDQVLVDVVDLLSDELVAVIGVAEI